jgi:hypothetical protein
MKRYKNRSTIRSQNFNNTRDISKHRSVSELPHVPVVATPPQIPQSNGEGMFGGIMSSVIQGVALGSGSQLASRGIDAIMGPRKIETVVSTSGSDDNTCLKEQDAYISCMRTGDADQCKNVFELLSKCKNINI